MNKIIAFHISTLTRGGAERVITNLANYFVTQNYKVYMFTELQEENEYSLDSRIERINLEMNPYRNRIANVFGRVTNIRKILMQKDVDILVSFIGKTNIRSILASLGTKVKVFVSVRSAPKREYNTVIRWFLAKTLFRFAAGVIFQTEDARNCFPKSIQKKSIILFNSVSLQYMKPSYTGIRDNEIVSVGRLEKVKNNELLIEAFRIIAEHNDSTVLKIYGNGSSKETLQNLVKRYNLEKRIIFMGDCENIDELIYKSRIFVQSSNFEGMPNALMEAMSLGLAVVSTDCPSGGPKSLIKNGINGILVPVNDPISMAQAIQKILDNSNLEKKLGENANLLGARLHPEKVNELWKKYIEDKGQISEELS